jgi:hypothetical protein
MKSRAKTGSGSIGRKAGTIPVRPVSAVGELFLAVADVLDEGTEPIARTGSAALRRNAQRAPSDLMQSLLPCSTFEMALTIPQVHAACGKLIPVFSLLNWHHSGLESGQIRAEISLQMLTCELVGPEGLVFDESCRVGLFAQGANLAYPERTHAAEELFVMLAGSAMWRQSGNRGTLRGPGSRIHHASFEPHSSTTSGEPLVAVWVWAGDIDFQTYTLHG